MKITSPLFRLPIDDIDTDQIIPARFLKVTERTGLGAHLFEDRRDVKLEAAAGRHILLAGKNFGCGSSREHAPWALTDFGFRAIIAPSFADIFRKNAERNALLPIIVDAATHARLAAAPPEAQVTIDLEAQHLILPDGQAVPFPIDPFVRRCLLDGTDELGYLLSFGERIKTYERSREDVS